MGLSEKIDATGDCSYNYSCLWSNESARCDTCTVVCTEGKDTLLLSGKAPPSCPYRERTENGETCRCPVRYELYRQQCGMHGIRAGLIITNALDTIINTNDWMEQFTGLTREQIIGVDIRSGFPPGIIGNLMPLYDQTRVMLKSQRFDKLAVASPKGQRASVSGWLIPATLDGKFNRMICTMEDTRG